MAAAPASADPGRGGHGHHRDPRRMNLETRDNWRYYRDDRRAYRVDRDTRKVLSVINLIDAFSN